MLFVTLHGGKPGKHPLNNNVQAYDKVGTKITSSVLEERQNVVLDELRGICRVGDLLYVANASESQNTLLCYQGSGTSYRFVSVFVSPATCKSIVHPFDFTFDDSGFCYISSQNTNVVTRLIVSADGKTGTPAPLAPALPQNGTFLPGTFVASSVANLCNMPTTAVPSPSGLEYSDDGDKKHSIRGLLWVNEALYVVDQPSGRVKVYDKTGKFLGQSNVLETPVHLALHDHTLYVTGADEVFSAKLSSPAGDFTLTQVPGLHIKNGCGMTFSEEGNVYIGSRTKNIVLKFDSNFKLMNFSCELSDNPEFLMHF